MAWYHVFVEQRRETRAMGGLIIGLAMLGGVVAVIGFVFYKASPLPEPTATGYEHWGNGG